MSRVSLNLYNIKYVSNMYNNMSRENTKMISMISNDILSKANKVKQIILFLNLLFINFYFF